MPAWVGRGHLCLEPGCRPRGEAEPAQPWPQGAARPRAPALGSPAQNLTSIFPATPTRHCLPWVQAEISKSQASAHSPQSEGGQSRELTPWTETLGVGFTKQRRELWPPGAPGNPADHHPEPVSEKPHKHACKGSMPPCSPGQAASSCTLGSPAGRPGVTPSGSSRTQLDPTQLPCRLRSPQAPS